MDERDFSDEFAGEYPALAGERLAYLPGTRIEVAGPFICSSCPPPERTYLEVKFGELLKECSSCGPETRWERTEKR